MNKSDDELKRDVSRFHGFAEWGAWIVVAALIAEVAVAFLLNDREYPLTVRWASIGANAFIAAGVAAEILFGRKASSAQDELQRRADIRVAEANARAKQAELELARLQAPRLLTVSQVETIGEGLRVFGPIEYDFRISMRDPEIENLQKLIKGILDIAGWKQRPFPDGLARCFFRRGEPLIGLDAEVANVLVAPDMHHEAELSLAASALSNGLNLAGITSESYPIGWRGRSAAIDKAIHIQIGRKMQALSVHGFIRTP